MDMPAYSPDLFVNRDQEIELVTRTAQFMSAGKSVSARTIIFRGTRGLGKSWLALHLKRTILAEFPNILPILINFDVKPKNLTHRDQYAYNNTEIFAETPFFRDMNHHNAIKYLVGRVSEIIEQATISNARSGQLIPSDVPPGELTGWLVRGIKQRFHANITEPSQHTVLSLILDSVFENDWALLEQLETQLLAPLAALPQVMIILTGRGRDYPWASPYLNGTAEVSDLKPFKLPAVTAQLERQLHDASGYAEKILQLGGGYPMNTLLIAQDLVRKSSLKDAVNQVLSVIEKQPDHNEIQTYLEALSVLDGFREEEIAPIVAARLRSSEADQQAYQLPSDMLDRLLKTHLVRWENRKYIIDESVRRILEYYLKSEEEQTWCRLHKRAYHLYRGWSNEFPRSREYYEARAQRHRQTLGADPDNVVC